jgi:hypothetical protein
MRCAQVAVLVVHGDAALAGQFQPALAQLVDLASAVAEQLVTNAS